MPDESTSTSTPESGSPEGGFAPITSQDDLNRIIGERLAREQKKYADYDQLKADAAKYREGQDASRSELEKAMDRIGRLESDLEASARATLRARVQAHHGVSDADAELFLTATDEAGLIRQAERLAQRDADHKKATSNHNPLAGRTSNSDIATEAHATVRQLFGGGD